MWERRVSWQSSTVVMGLTPNGIAAQSLQAPALSFVSLSLTVFEYCTFVAQSATAWWLKIKANLSLSPPKTHTHTGHGAPYCTLDTALQLVDESLLTLLIRGSEMEVSELQPVRLLWMAQGTPYLL